MNKNIILAGVGGQGILTIAAVIDLAAMHVGLKVKQAEVHGMSQRGGAVQSHLRISSDEIFSDLIALGNADLILSVEPMEALRYLPYLSKNGTIVTSTEPFKNINPYPEEAGILAELKKSGKCIFVDAAKLSREVGSPKTSNIIMLGAATPFVGIAQEDIVWAIRTFFASKPKEMVDMNLEAYKIGIALSTEYFT
jgi:indolepyruvate ferredoxin oxidoreductase beta subunit